MRGPLLAEARARGETEELDAVRSRCSQWLARWLACWLCPAAYERKVK